MENIHLTKSVRVLHGAVNMGLVATEHGVVAIDTGLDKQAGKQILKAANEWGKPIVAIVNTHAHADHFGGNHVILAANEGHGVPVPVYAPVFEADVIKRPQYEPEYLWHGATPVAPLRNKFLEAKKSPVTHEFTPGDPIVIDGVSFKTVSLAGHSINQAGVIVDCGYDSAAGLNSNSNSAAGPNSNYDSAAGTHVLFAADSYFAKEVTEKHGIPFMVDYRQTLASMRVVLEQNCDFFVPGHGRPTDKPPVEDVSFLAESHEALFDYTVSRIRKEPITLEQLIRDVCVHKEVNLTTLGGYVLIRTPISAYITAAMEDGLVEIEIRDGQVMLYAK
jgi:glyoxylase-like metal-dependent hydrolase (beta-lactamase superfamily II)